LSKFLTDGNGNPNNLGTCCGNCRKIARSGTVNSFKLITSSQPKHMSQIVMLFGSERKLIVVDLTGGNSDTLQGF
jgi:hypothetical protein